MFVFFKILFCHVIIFFLKLFPGPPHNSPKLSNHTYCPTSTSSIVKTSHLSQKISPVLHDTRTLTQVTFVNRKNPGPTAQSLNKSDKASNISPTTLSSSFLQIAHPKYPPKREPVTNAKACIPLLHPMAGPSEHKSVHRNVEPSVGAFNTRVRYSEYLATGTESNV